MGRRRKLVLGAAAGFAVLVLAVLFGWRDDPPPQDSDLRPVVAAAAGADDAYQDFLKMQAGISLSIEERTFLGRQLDGTASDWPQVERLIARNAGVLALFADFSRRPVFQDPHYRDLAAIGTATPVPQLFSIVAAARLSSFHAASMARKGRPAEALEESLRIVDAGRMLSRSHQPILLTLVGMLLTDAGSKTALEIVGGGTLARGQLLAAAARLSAPSGAAEGFKDGMRFEYVMMANLMEQLAASVRAEAPQSLPRVYGMVAAAKMRYFFMPQRTKGLFAGRFRLLVTEADKPCLQVRVPPFTETRIGVSPNVVGRLLYNIAIPQYEKIIARRCEADFRQTAAAVAAATRAYRLDHGRYPAVLAELVPGYLPTAPVDPFNGEPPRYSTDTGEVHSVGTDSDGKPL